MQRTPARNRVYLGRHCADTSYMTFTRLLRISFVLLFCAVPLAAPAFSGPRLPEPRLPGAALDHSSAVSAPNDPRNTRDDTRDDVLDLERGLASWYGGKFQGRMTANGEIFDTNDYTAAHRTLPFDTVVRVVNPETEASVTVRINDRGPFIEGRIIDLSRAAAEAIGIAGRGVAPVVLEIIEYPEIKDYQIIQVASFGSRSNAEALKRRLAAEGLSATIETTSAGNHRVLLPEVPRTEIESHRRSLEELGFPGILVREP